MIYNISGYRSTPCYNDGFYSKIPDIVDLINSGQDQRILKYVYAQLLNVEPFKLKLCT